MIRIFETTVQALYAALRQVLELGTTILIGSSIDERSKDKAEGDQRKVGSAK